MRIASLTTMTAVALMAFAPAFAAENSATPTGSTAETGMSTTTETETDVTTGAAETGSWRDQELDTRAAYDTENQAWEIAVLGADGTPEYKTIWQSNTADGILDKEVKNPTGKTVASVDDIIIDSGGNAQNVIVTYGGFLGLGEDRVALDYDQVIARGDDGDSLNTIDEATLKQARPFSYDQEADGEVNQMTMASTNISVDKFMGAEVRDPQGEAVATAENVHFKNGKAEHVLMSLDDGMSEDIDSVALPFAELQLVREDEDYHFELSSVQADSLRNYQNVADVGSDADDAYMDMETDTDVMPENQVTPNGDMSATEEY